MVGPVGVVVVTDDLAAVVDVADVVQVGEGDVERADLPASLADEAVDRVRRQQAVGAANGTAVDVLADDLAVVVVALHQDLAGAGRVEAGDLAAPVLDEPVLRARRREAVVPGNGVGVHPGGLAAIVDREVGLGDGGVGEAQVASGAAPGIAASGEYLPPR